MSKKLFVALGAFALGIGAGVALKELWDRREALLVKGGEDEVADPVLADAVEAACEDNACEACEQACCEPMVDEAQENEKAQEPIFDEAVALIVGAEKASTTLLQRRLGIGYGRAARMIERMEELGLVSPADGYRARKVLPAAAEYLELLNNSDK